MNGVTVESRPYEGALRQEGFGCPGTSTSATGADSISWGGRGEAQETLHHLLDLRLGRAPVSYHRLLDAPGGVLRRNEPRARARHERGPPCVAQK